MTHEQFERLFKTKQIKDKWYCYGTWNGQDLSYEADTEDNARIEAYNKLIKCGYLLSKRLDVLRQYAVKATPGGVR